MAANVSWEVPPGPLPRSKRTAVLFFALLLPLAPALGHNPETSYLRVVLAGQRLEVRLTFDLFALQRIALVDADADQRVTRDELQRAAPAIENFLRDRVRLEIDGRRATLGEAAPPVWPRDAGEILAARDWHSNESLIALPFRQTLAAPVREILVTFDVFETLGMRHIVLGSFEYRGGAEEVTFTSLEPDFLFDVKYAEAGENSDATPRREPSLLANLSRFTRLGVAHIFLGYDHICFLLALLVVSRFRELVKIVTSFTVAHSHTLILASMGVARLPSRFVECAVAATIVYVAAENFWRKSMSHRWMLTFGFGLIHGFSFATVLAELGLPAIGRVRCLLAFNVGVEIGQLAIVCGAFPLLVLLGRWRYGQRATAVVSIAVGLFGLGWFIERAFGLKFMPV